MLNAVTVAPGIGYMSVFFLQVSILYVQMSDKMKYVLKIK